MPPSHEEVLAAGKARAVDMQALVAEIVARIPMAQFAAPLPAAAAFSGVARRSWLQRLLKPQWVLGAACVVGGAALSKRGAPQPLGPLLQLGGLYAAIFGWEAPSLALSQHNREVLKWSIVFSALALVAPLGAAKRLSISV